MKKAFLVIIVSVLAVFVVAYLIVHLGTARKYIDMYEVAPSTSYWVLGEFQLLTRPEVRYDMKISQSQQEDIEESIRSTLELIRIKKMNPELSFEEMMDHSYIIKESQLYGILVGRQRSRLKELINQVRGPRSIVGDRALFTTLQLSASQEEKINSIIHDYQERIGGGISEIGRLFFRECFRIEIVNDIYAESIISMVSFWTMVRDMKILSVLSSGQRDTYQKAKGVTLPIQWRVEDLLYLPNRTQPAPAPNVSATRR